jgi:hypothetical protein
MDAVIEREVERREAADDQQKQIDDQQKQIDDQQKQIDDQQKQIDSLRGMMHTLAMWCHLPQAEPESSEQYYSRDRPKILAETFQQNCSIEQPSWTFEQVVEHYKNGGNGSWVFSKQ